MNLVSNASKPPPRAAACAVGIEHGATLRWLVVADDGVGISARVLARDLRSDVQAPGAPAAPGSASHREEHRRSPRRRHASSRIPRRAGFMASGARGGRSPHADVAVPLVRSRRSPPSPASSVLAEPAWYSARRGRSSKPTKTRSRAASSQAMRALRVDRRDHPSRSSAAEALHRLAVLRVEPGAPAPIGGRRRRASAASQSTIATRSPGRESACLQNLLRDSIAARSRGPRKRGPTREKLRPNARLDPRLRPGARANDAAARARRRRRSEHPSRSSRCDSSRSDSTYRGGRRTAVPALLDEHAFRPSPSSTCAWRRSTASTALLDFDACPAPQPAVLIMTAHGSISRARRERSGAAPSTTSPSRSSPRSSAAR
jgi:hypothetical protein